MPALISGIVGQILSAEMVAKMKKNGAGAEAYAPSNHFSKPSWLLCTIAGKN